MAPEVNLAEQTGRHVNLKAIESQDSYHGYCRREGFSLRNVLPVLLDNFGRAQTMRSVIWAYPRWA
jgi:hypothetical protein